MDHNKNNQLKAFVLGATGAVGRELLEELLKSPRWSKVTIVVRRKLEEWESFPDEEKRKLEIILESNLDKLSEPSHWNLAGYNSIFSCLGAALNADAATAAKAERTYPMDAVKLALYFQIPHFSFVTGHFTNKKSCIKPFRVKGETEEAIAALNLPHLSIFRPGFITHRRNGERLIEKIMNYTPFAPKINAKDCGRSLQIEAELQADRPSNISVIRYSNNQMHELVKGKQYPKNLGS